MPYLTCNDQPDTTSFILELDGTDTTESPAQNGHAWIDITGVSVGSHTVRLRAKNEWGVSDYSPPLDFAKVLPGAPSGLGLRAE